MNITVKRQYVETPITVTWKEDGLIMHCNHAGADYIDEDVTSIHTNSRTGELETTDSSMVVLACDKCPAWFDDLYGGWQT